MTASPRSSCTLAAALALALLAQSTWAQQLYRQVGPDGRVSYSDQPPAASSVGTTTSAGPGAASSAALPYELRQVAARYPVVLYTSKDCAPCAPARNLLAQRGIPFAERSVDTFEDNQALLRLSGANSLPLLTIGNQQLKGFSEAEWGQYLTAAGYPKSSQLPAGYRQAPATPLVAQQAAPAASPAPAAVPPRAAPAQRAAPEQLAPRTNAAGIQF